YVSLIRKKFRWETIFLIGLKRYRDPKEEPIGKKPLMELKEIGRFEKFVVYCDASNRGLGCVLMQREGAKYAPMKWIKLFKDFDSDIRYHLRKANVVADALSRKERVKPRRVVNVTAEMLHSMDQLIERKEDRGMKYIWDPLIDDVRTLIMDEAHALRYLVDPRTDKTYYDLRGMYGGHV
nr:hypothetical protein [Tanacetum cinerariifolium]